MDDSAKPRFPDADSYGRSLTGFGVNILVADVAASLAFLSEVLTVDVVHAEPDFAVCRYQGHQWMLHSDASYHSNPLLALTGDGVIRGAGVELRLYGVDPDAAVERAEARGFPVLQPPADKPHGLREAYIAGPEGYVWVPSVHKAKKPQP
jgi:catechol 2,3-dioxygenase-like lactoylglutathione lyase family enzyme